MPRLAVPFTILTVSLLLACFAFVWSGSVSAAPTTMNFQGRLADSSGTVVPNGLYNMQFRLFTVASGGAATWTETRETTNRVQVTNGLFSVRLGEVTPLSASLFSGNDVYFEITLPTPGTATCDTAACASWEAPMSPRHKMATSAYAFQADNADTLDGLDSTAFAAASGSANYIQNTTSPQTANFNITGNGTIGGTLIIQGSVSSPGGSQSEKFGASASASADNSVAIGYNAVASNAGSVVIGSGANTGTTTTRNSVVIGLQATLTDLQYGGVAIGALSSAGRDGLALGLSASGAREAIAIGKDSTTSTGSISIGLAANSFGTSVALGTNSSAGGTNGGAVAVGHGAYADRQGTAIGQNASAARDNITLGNGATATTGQGNAIVIGNNAASNHYHSIAIGAGALSTANNQLVIGGASSGIYTAYLGNGVTAASPQGSTISATGGSGSDVNGASLAIAGGKSTGLGMGGSLLFQTSSPQSGGSGDGSYLNVLSTRMEIQGNGNISMDTSTLFVDSQNDRVGIGTTTPGYLLDIRKTQNGPIFTRIYNDRNGGNDIAGLIVGTNTSGTHFQLRVHNGGGGESATLGGSNSVNFNNTANGNMTFLTNNSERLRIHNTGAVSIGSTASNGQLLVTSATSSTVGTVIQAASSQSADLLQIQDSTSAVLAFISASGQIFQGANQVCDTSNNCNYALASGSANYIQNGTSPQTSDFNITGTGTANVLQANTLDRATSGTLMIGGTNATAITLADNTAVSGDLSVSGSSIFASIKQQYSKAITVDAGGKGDYTTISAAYAAAVALTPSSTNRIAIFVYPGVYDESLTMTTDYISLIGSGRENTVMRRSIDANILTINAAVVNASVEGVAFEATVSNNNTDIIRVNGAPNFKNNKVTTSPLSLNIDMHIDASGATGGVYTGNIFEGGASSGDGGVYIVNGEWSYNLFRNGAEAIAYMTGGRFVNNTIDGSGLGYIVGGHIANNVWTAAPGGHVRIYGGKFVNNDFTGGSNASNAGTVNFYAGTQVEFIGGSIHNPSTAGAVKIYDATASPTFTGTKITTASAGDRAFSKDAAVVNPITIKVSNSTISGTVQAGITLHGTYTNLSAAQTNLVSSGTAVFNTVTDSTTAFQVQNAAGASMLNVDTLNGRVGIGTLTPAAALEIFQSAGNLVRLTTSAASARYLEFNVGLGTDIRGFIEKSGADGIRIGTPEGHKLSLTGGSGIVVDGGSTDPVIDILRNPISDAYIRGSSASASNQFAITSAGRLVLGGYSANAKLDVQNPESSVTALFNKTGGGTEDVIQAQVAGVNVMSVGSSGNAMFQNSVNSAQAFRVQNAAGTSVLNVDTVNNRIGINTSSPPVTALQVIGAMRAGDGSSYGQLQTHILNLYNSAYNRTLNLNMSTTRGVLSISDTSQFGIQLNSTEQFSIDSSGGVGIYNSTPLNRLSVNTLVTADTAAQVAVSTGSATNKGLIIQGAGSQSAALLQLQNSAGTSLASFDSGGALTVTSAGVNRSTQGAGWLELQNQGGNITTRLTQGSNEQLIIGAGSSGNYLGVRINAPSNSTGALNLRTVSGHSGLLLGLQNSSGGTMAGFNANGDLSVGGSNAVNSATALLVQNASSSALLTVDSSNSRVTIGASDTTGVLLVLDTKTSSGDPTGVNGAMYYNSDAQKFRCYENSAWKDCVPTTTKVINLMPVRTNIGGSGSFIKNTAVMTDLSSYNEVRIGFNREFTPGYSCTDGSSATIQARYSTNNGSTWSTLDSVSNSATDNTVTTWGSLPGGAIAPTVHLGVHASCSIADVDGFMTDFTVEFR